MKRNVCYCYYYSTRHLELVRDGWSEQHCLYADGEVYIKMVMYAI